mgnify:CR=1 FL=1
MNIYELDLPSNRKFGFFFTFIFVLAAAYFYYSASEIWVYVFIAIALIFILQPDEPKKFDKQGMVKYNDNDY